MSVDLTGAADLHAHFGPDPHRTRSVTGLEAAQQAARRRARRDRAQEPRHARAPGSPPRSTRWSTDVAVFGGVCCDHEIGGMNVAAIEVALRLGARIVWLPTLSSAQDVANGVAAQLGIPGPGLRVTDADDRLTPETHGDPRPRRRVRRRARHRPRERGRAPRGHPRLRRARQGPRDPRDGGARRARTSTPPSAPSSPRSARTSSSARSRASARWRRARSTTSSRASVRSASTASRSAPTSARASTSRRPPGCRRTPTRCSPPGSPRPRSAGWPARTRTRSSPATAEPARSRPHRAPYDRGVEDRITPGLYLEMTETPDRDLRGRTRPEVLGAGRRAARDVVGQRAPRPRRPAPQAARVPAPRGLRGRRARSAPPTPAADATGHHFRHYPPSRAGPPHRASRPSASRSS